MLGYATITVVVAAGVGPVVARSSMALSALTLCGAAYLIHLGAGVLRSPVPHVEAVRADEMPATSPARYVLRGAGVSALNPKGLLIFLSILPQFARPAFAWPIPLQLTVLGAVFTLACGLSTFHSATPPTGC
jgi:threonine/homoserine/homoserine lactone efflux protein